MKLKIKITKDVLKRSVYCGVNHIIDDFERAHDYTSNCAISIAVNDIFPGAVTGMANMYVNHVQIPLPRIAIDFIRKFDDLIVDYNERLNISEFDFEIDVPEQLINSIGINQVYEILKNSKSLELVELHCR